MDTKVRDLFRTETRDLIEISSFKKVYAVFEQLVMYDIDVPELEGLGERLKYAFTKIATEKIDRNDIITFFPIIWGKFETYARMVLFLTNRKSYQKLNDDDTFVNVLDRLGIKVFVTTKDRNEKTEAIFQTYNVRNLDAHKCEKWSIRKFYETLGYTLAAYLIVTDYAYGQLEKCLMRKVGFNPSEHEIKIGSVDILDSFYSWFDNINIVNNKVNSIRHGATERIFDERGLMIKETYSANSNYPIVGEFDYEFEDDLLRKQNRNITHYHSDKVYETTKEIHCYEYDQEGRLSAIKVYEDKCEDKKRSVEIEYLTNGGVSIKDMVIREANSRQKEPSVSTSIRTYDENGNLLLVQNGKGKIISKYEYSDGLLTEGKDAWGSFKVQYIGDNIVKERWSSNLNEYYVSEKQHYIDNRLVEIRRFNETNAEGIRTTITYR